MTRMIRAEMSKLVRGRVLAAWGLAAALFALVATPAVWLSADDGPTRGPGATLASLAAPGGMTETFATAVAFTGILVFVTFIGTVSSEFGRGTFRTLLMREPRRMRVVAGKLTAQVAFTAGFLVVAALLTVAGSFALAPVRDVPTTEWLTATGLGDALGDLLPALAMVAGWAVLGTTVAVLIRSTAVAIGIGAAWAGPLEHLVGDVWSEAYRFLPGLLLEAVGAGGTDDVPLGYALAASAAWAAVALAITAVVVVRRDVVG